MATSISVRYVSAPGEAPRSVVSVHEWQPLISRFNQPFAQISTDMTLEQSINLDSKSKGGIIGISQKPDALERWFLTSLKRAAITSSLKEMCSLENSDRIGTHHKEARPRRLQRDEQDVQKLVSCFTSGLMTDPFCLDNDQDGRPSPLINIATGVVLPDEVSERLIKATD